MEQFTTLPLCSKIFTAMSPTANRQTTTVHGVFRSVSIHSTLPLDGGDIVTYMYLVVCNTCRSRALMDLLYIPIELAMTSKRNPGKPADPHEKPK